MDFWVWAAKVLEAVIAKLIADGIEAAAKKALHFARSKKQTK